MCDILYTKLCIAAREDSMERRKSGEEKKGERRWPRNTFLLSILHWSWPRNYSQSSHFISFQNHGWGTHITVCSSTVTAPLLPQRLRRKRCIRDWLMSLQMSCRGRGKAQLLTRCLNSAERLPLLDSSMFITLVFVPKMLNFRDLEGQKMSFEILSK